MKNKTIKSQISTITIITIITISAIIFALPVSNAQSNKTSYSYIGAIPNPVGVNQQVLLHVGITDYLQSPSEGWEGLTVTVTKPDGTTETLGPIKTDSTGGTGTVFVPDQIGTHTLQTHFPEQDYNGVTYLASESEELTLVVQVDPIEYYPSHALPTEYWTRPIDSQLREWNTVAGSWLNTPDPSIVAHFQSNYAPNNQGPETAHILWTKPLTTGGLVGTDNTGMIIGDAYEGKWASRFIINGKLYYIDTAGGMIFAPTTGTDTKYHCVDLHTGEELWVKTFLNNQTIAFGQLLNWQTLNSHGTFAYLWVQVGGGFSPIPATWYAFDAFTGDWRFTIQNVPRGTTMVDDSGAIYILQTDLTNGRIALWNMTKLCTTSSAGFQSASWGNSVNGKTFNAGDATPAAMAAWEWNETIPTGLPGGVVTTFFGDRIIGSDLGSNIQGSGATPTTTIWGLSLKQGQEGTLLFNATWMTPIDWIEGNKSLSWRAHSAEDKVGVIWSAESREHYGVSYETGQLIWGPNSPQNYLDAYSPMANRAVAYGKLYVTGVSGTVYCYNITTGERLWIYHANDKYSEVLWANNWWLGVMFVTDGKIYLGHLEHSPIQPLPRGAPFICLNTTNGDEIWLADGMFRQTFWGGRAIIGDSIIATQDTYDQRVYAIGKGPSKTSVTASPKVSVHGSSVMIEGMVTDVSPGTNDPAIAMRFPNGVPAVSDDSMSDWMLYVYKQFERPTNALGVQVIIETYDPNGNYQNLGTAFTDANGEYGLAFVPEVPGTYWISATFEGSNGYYSSTSSTYITVDESPDVGPTVTVTEYPGYQGPSASEVAQNVVNNLPDNPTSAEIAQAVENQLDIPEPAEIPEYPEYTTMDIIIIILVVIAIVIGVVSLLRKRD